MRLDENVNLVHVEPCEYRDQFGISHPCALVVEHVVATVVEVKDVEEAYTGIPYPVGLRAVDVSTGAEFYNSWKGFSDTPYRYSWVDETGGWWNVPQRNSKNRFWWVRNHAVPSTSPLMVRTPDGLQKFVPEGES